MTTEFTYFCVYNPGEGPIVEYPHPFYDNETKSNLYKVFSQVGASTSVETFKNGKYVY